jgi:nitrogen fixation-related uncharacterized protein
MDLLTIIIVLALLATCVTLGLGLLTMSSGGYNDKEFGTPLMWTRIGLQAATLLLLGLAVALR